MYIYIIYAFILRHIIQHVAYNKCNVMILLYMKYQIRYMIHHT